MRIIFMGTDEFAVPTLEYLANLKDPNDKYSYSRAHRISGVFTPPPKPKGRGMKLTKSPVHEAALAHEIPVYNHTSLKTYAVAELIDFIDADVIIVAAYGLIVPKNILSAKKYGSLNIHPSSLPKYRGAAPIQRTIMAGESISGISIIQMDEGVDTGDVILHEPVAFDARDNFKQTYDKCARISAVLMAKVLSEIDTLPRVKQPEEGVSYAPKLTKEEGQINWNDDSFKIDCMVRGMNPWPGVYFHHEGKMIKILSAIYNKDSHDYAPGQIINDDFEVACGSGTLRIESLKPEGKPEMSAKDYLRGAVSMSKGTILSSK
ncbi:MAG: methionyl-tRNA formyltransferase [Rickettsiales bacterium]|nr:MAG: methionyl-tRNA formyltransferase [Rickettsiales bacterium]